MKVIQVKSKHNYHAQIVDGRVIAIRSEDGYNMIPLMHKNHIIKVRLRAQGYSVD